MMNTDTALDLTTPDIPLDIFNLSLEDADLTYHLRCQELWVEVYEEVMDSDYSGRQHHTTGTYDVGCQGILCRKAVRDNPRRKIKSVTPYQIREDRIYDPVIEYFHIVIKHRIRTLQQKILKEIKEAK